MQGKAGPICDTTQFSVTGDITVDKERVTNLKEHREFEKEFGMSISHPSEFDRGAKKRWRLCL